MYANTHTTPIQQDYLAPSIDEFRAAIAYWDSRTHAEFLGLMAAPHAERTSISTNSKETKTRKVRGKSMSRRSGQSGSIEKSGKWYVVRFYEDVAGQVERPHRRVKICPTSGPGALSPSARKRCAQQIVNESGANSEAQFKRNNTGYVTFAEQAVIFFEQISTRKRHPVSASTYDGRKACVNKHLDPLIGMLPLSEVNNKVLKQVVDAMSKAGLKPATITDYVKVLKAVVASAVNDEGEEIYQRNWNNHYVDMPIIDKAKQNSPCFSAGIVTGLANYPEERERTVFCLCAALGMRIGEALGLEIGKHISADGLVVSVEQTVRRRKIQLTVKTAAARRQIDVHPDIAAMLIVYIGERKSGLLFCAPDGKPLSADTLRTAHLYPALKELGYFNPVKGDHTAGCHAFRRFRNTYLRNFTSCPEGLRAYWMGHAAKTMGDLYDKIKEDKAFRREWAAKCGFGFELPSPRPPHA